MATKRYRVVLFVSVNGYTYETEVEADSKKDAVNQAIAASETDINERSLDADYSLEQIEEIA